MRHSSIDIGHHFRYIPLRIKLAHRGRRREVDLKAERVRCPWAELRPAPGRLRASACRHYDRRARCIAGTGSGVGGKPQRLAPSPTKPGPTLSLRDEDSLWREPWWNADRRARPQRRVGASRLFVARTAPAGADISNASAGVPLPFLS